jgi:MOSC domain-containing protein YiiM
MRKIGTVISVNASTHRGISKEPVVRGYLEHGYGLQGDAHAGDWHRQVSLFSVKSMDQLSEEERIDCEATYFENITIDGEQLRNFLIGTVFRVGEAHLEMTQAGLSFARDTADHTLREVIMHDEGIYAVVRESGWVQVGDFVYVEK